MEAEQTASTVKVTAPSNLDAGYEFEATVGDRTFTVTVPEGGVKEGEEFEVPYPVGDGDKKEKSEQALEKSGAPTGAWKTTLCSCCEVVQSGLFWMACCCTPLVEGQMLTRLSLDWCGMPTADASSTFGAVAIIFVIYLICNFWIPFVGIAFLIYSLIYGTRLRSAFRRKFEIPTSVCGEKACLDDCCCMCWCGCCTAIQMARHTHDEGQYPYQCCNSNGLPNDAPAIV